MQRRKAHELNPLYKVKSHNGPSLFPSPLPTFAFKECLGSYLCDNKEKWYSACGSRASCSSLALPEWLGFYMVLIKFFLLSLASSRVVTEHWQYEHCQESTKEHLKSSENEQNLWGYWLLYNKTHVKENSILLFSVVRTETVLTKASKVIIVLQSESRAWQLNWVLIMNDSASWRCTLMYRTSPRKGKMMYLPLIINKPSQYTKYELLEKAESISN